MTGLIWKDFYVMGKALKSYLLIMAVYFVLAWMDLLDFAFIVTFIQVLLMVMPLTAFAYDEQAKWDRYAFSLPLGRSAVVRARYLFVLLLALLTSAFGLACTVLLSLAGRVELMEMTLTTLVSSAIGLLIPAIILPLSYKLGPERARPYLYAIVFLPIVAGVLLNKLGLLDLSALDALEALSPSTVTGLACLLPLGALGALWVSYLASCRVVAGKEF